MKSLYSIASILVLLLLVGCATIPQVQYKKVSTVSLLDPNESEQTKNNISISVKPLDTNKELKNPVYTQEFQVVYIPMLSTAPVAAKISKTVDYFWKTTPYEITVVNNTDHILRMKDSRVAYIDPNLDEPVMALDPQSIIVDKTLLPVYQGMIDLIKKEYKPVDDTYTFSIGLAIDKITKVQKFVTGFNKEIMPGMRSSGIVVIPIEPEKASEGKLSFIDMVSKTDQAGNPIERVRFDYRIKLVDKYYKYDKSISSDWVEIQANEFNASSTAVKN